MALETLARSRVIGDGTAPQYAPYPMTRRTVAIQGDSRTQYNFDQSATFIAGRPRWWNLANALLGQRFDLVANAGVAGQTSAALLARINNTTAGTGFGAVGDTTTAPTTSPGSLGFNPGIVIDSVGFNDIVSIGNSAATAWTTKLQCFELARQSGAMLVVCTIAPPTSTITNYSAAKMVQLRLLNDMIRNYAATTDGVLLADFYAAMVDPASAVIEGNANDFVDGTHENNSGGMKEALVLAAVMERLAPPRDVLPASNAETYALDPLIPQLLPNPLLTGSVAISGAAGFSGNIPSNQVGTNYFRSGSASAVLSLVPQRQGYGQGQKLATTFTASSETIEMRMPSQHANVVVGGQYIAVCEYSVTGPGGAALAAADNFRGCQLVAQYYNGTSFYTSSMNTLVSQDKPYVGNHTLTLVTRPLLIPSGVGTLFRPYVTIYAGGAGSPEVTVSRVGLVRVA